MAAWAPARYISTFPSVSWISSSSFENALSVAGTCGSAIPRKFQSLGDHKRLAMPSSGTANNKTYSTNCTRWASHFRSEEHTSELQSLMRISYAVFCLKKKKHKKIDKYNTTFCTQITNNAVSN